ncbi:MAG: terminase family protein [Rhodocyclaceae bacterium]|nr:terminase family protein [Rhodocyclaceae bacterium]
MPSRASPAPYFLPYQIDWIKDTSRFKIVEKSRRVGMTYAQSYEDVVDAARAKGGMDVWFSSADETAAREYIRYCAQWAKLFDIAARDLGELVIDKKDDIKAFVIELASGKRINALSSNPKAFRSKGGKLVLDEFAFHPQPEEMWKAARPIITWGFPVRVLSTYNGKGNRYYRLVEDAKKGNQWRLHTVNIEQAVAQGLADKIVGRPLTAEERAQWIAEERATCGDEETWMQEYMCVPVDEATAWLPWELITSAEHADAGRPELYQGGDCYVGMDIGRRRDLTVIWVIEKVGDVFWQREIVRMKNKSFAEQDAELARIFATYRVRRACMDQSGMGEKPVEDAKRVHGTYRVEGVIFSGPVKQHLATLVKQRYEDRRVRVMSERQVRESHHAVRKVQTVAGNPRFDADRSEVGHADEFWAHALALHAAEDSIQPAAGATVEAEQDDYLPESMRGRRRMAMFR